MPKFPVPRQFFAKFVANAKIYKHSLFIIWQRKHDKIKIDTNTNRAKEGAFCQRKTDHKRKDICATKLSKIIKAQYKK